MTGADVAFFLIKKELKSVHKSKVFNLCDKKWLITENHSNNAITITVFRRNLLKREKKRIKTDILKSDLVNLHPT